jgi:hypothetical protein
MAYMGSGYRTATGQEKQVLHKPLVVLEAVENSGMPAAQQRSRVHEARWSNEVTNPAVGSRSCSEAG